MSATKDIEVSLINLLHITSSAAYFLEVGARVLLKVADKRSLRG